MFFPIRPATIALLLALSAPILLSPYQVSVMTYIMMFSIVCIGLVLLTGIAGMISFGQAAFVGVGAYVTGYLTTAYPISPWFGLVAALVVTAVSARLIGAITVKMSGHYLALATLAFGISFYFVVGNTEALGNFNGITSIPALVLGPYELKSERACYYAVLAFLSAAVWWTIRVLNSRVGRIMRSLRQGSLIAESFGESAERYKLFAFVAAAVLAAVAGWLYAHVQRFVNPTPFGVHMGVEYLFMTVIGGSGHVWGALAGAGLVTLLKQWLQEGLRPIFGATTRLEMAVFAGIVLLVLCYAQTGIWPFVQRIAGRWRGRKAVPRCATLDGLRERPAAGTPVLNVAGMRKTFGGLVAVDDVSLDVRAGEIVGLLGPNGAGKSTMFNLISGVLAPSAGSAVFMSKQLRGYSSRRISQLGIARTFQHVKIVPDMSVIENVAIGCTRLGRRGATAAALMLDRAEERRLLGWSAKLLDRVGLLSKATSPAGSLPLGHQRILEIARALAADPLLLLLDEPAAGLRAHEKRQLANLLAELRAEGLAILLVEHDMEFVMRLADRLVVMNFGCKIAEGAPAEVRASLTVQEAYLGVAA